MHLRKSKLVKIFHYVQTVKFFLASEFSLCQDFSQSEISLQSLSSNSAGNVVVDHKIFYDINSAFVVLFFVRTVGALTRSSPYCLEWLSCKYKNSKRFETNDTSAIRKKQKFII